MINYTKLIDILKKGALQHKKKSQQKLDIT